MRRPVVDQNPNPMQCVCIVSRSYKKPYRKSRRFDKGCRCHGSCSYRQGNRLHTTNRDTEDTDAQLRAYRKEYREWLEQERTSTD